MNRGEVYWANLTTRSGSEQTGRRCVIVVSHDEFNQTRGWRSVIIVPLSTSLPTAARADSCCLAQGRRRVEQGRYRVVSLGHDARSGKVVAPYR